MGKEKNYDVIIVGAGPAGLSFSCSLINLDLKVAVVEKSAISSISSPKPDGRETALTPVSYTHLTLPTKRIV